jgi:hypothetical protein
MLIWHKSYGLLIMAVFTFITLGLIGRNMPKARLRLLKTMPQASMLQEADALFKTILTPETLQSIVDLIPLEWLDWQDTDESLKQYVSLFSVLSMRLNHSQIFIKKPKCKRNTYMSTR